MSCASRQPRHAITARAPRPEILSPCTVAGGPARCGFIEVAENRDSSDARKISVHVVVLTALDSSHRDDAVALLAGGPGQAAAELAPWLAEQFQVLRAHRDILLIDQRGTGQSNALGCPKGMGILGDAPDVIRACADSLSAHANLTQYSTAAAVSDLDDIRGALGYRTLDLIGISYGTRVAQAYLARFPGNTRTVTLRAAAPIGFNIPRDGERNAKRALDRTVSDCAADAGCAAAFPRLRTELESMFRLADATRRSSDTSVVAIDRALLGQTLYALLLSVPSRQSVPLLIHRAASEGLEALAPIASQIRSAVYGPLPVGMYLSIVCAEDVAMLTPAERKELTGPGTLVSRGIVEACDSWPAARSVQLPSNTVPWNGPALIVSGEADPATDVAIADALARSWSGARHVVLPATAHGPMFPGCSLNLLAEFIERADAAGLDASCIADLKWPPFATVSRPVAP